MARFKYGSTYGTFAQYFKMGFREKRNILQRKGFELEADLEDAGG